MFLSAIRFRLNFRPCPFTPWTAERLAEPSRHRRSGFSRTEIIDTSLPRKLRRDGWWLET